MSNYREWSNPEEIVKKLEESGICSTSVNEIHNIINPYRRSRGFDPSFPVIHSSGCPYLKMWPLIKLEIDSVKQVIKFDIGGAIEDLGFYGAKYYYDKKRFTILDCFKHARRTFLQSVLNALRKKRENHEPPYVQTSSSEKRTESSEE